MGAGTITQIVSKSGTNQFHGRLFDVVRYSAFDARNFFATSVPPFRRNEFGGTFGDPTRRDKTFFLLGIAGCVSNSESQMSFLYLPRRREREQ